MRFLRKAKKEDIKGTAILRLDFNTEDDWRLKASLPTLNFLVKNSERIVILSHRGRPSFLKSSSGKSIAVILKKEKPLHLQSKFSLKEDAKKLEKLLKKKIFFLPYFDFPEIEKTIKNSPRGSIFLLENLRFLKEEVQNNVSFAKKLSALGDFYVNDAFAVSHRENASVSAITKFLPAYAGLELEKELLALNSAIKSPAKPLVVILGGGKAEEKLAILDNLKKGTDAFLLGGVAANTLLFIEGIDTKKSIRAKDKKSIDVAKKLLKNKKVFLPVDWQMEKGFILDIGPKTFQLFSKKITAAKTIIWNGPMGLIEKKKFEKGTLEIARAISKNRKAFSLVGGGETVMFLKKYNLDKKMKFVSTGGGAMLDFLAGKTLPGIKALEK